VLIRRASPRDVPALRALARAAFEVYVPRIGREPVPVAADYAAAVDAGQVWVATRDADIAGLLVIVPHETHLLLEIIAVHPDAQGTGIGSTLLAVAEREAHALGLPEIRLYTNEAMTENLAYYPKQGYIETHRDEWNGFRRVYYSKKLS